MGMPIIPESATAAREIMRQPLRKSIRHDLIIICAALLYHARRSHLHAVEDIGLMSDSDRADTDLRILAGRTTDDLHCTALAIAIAIVHDWSDDEAQALRLIATAQAGGRSAS